LKAHALLSLGLAAGLVVAAGAARANDTVAELATGGLVFTKTADIEMRSEDLYVSMEEIRVAYRFFNTSAQDKTATVAFPMPDITLDYGGHMISVPHEGSENFLDFSTKADGKPVATEIEAKAFGNGVDQTALLRKLGVPLYPTYEYDGLTALPRAQWDELVKLGLGEIDETDQRLLPAWTLKTTYHFQQTFPAGREVVIEHRYKPSVGGMTGTGIGMTDPAEEPDFAQYLRDFCVDKGLLAAVDRAKAAAKSESAPFWTNHISYILKTGANWAAPIKDFRLVVDKGAAANLVSFCADGVKKISPTRFEVRKSDYTPTADLNILILTPSPVQ